MDDQGLDLVFIDPSLLVLRKPGGLLAVPGRGPDQADCVVGRVKARFPDCMAQPAVHRLDQPTSGLMVLARGAAAHRELSRQFSQRLVRKGYVALLEGRVEGEAGEIRLTFRLDPDRRPYQVLDPEHGKPGITRWRRLAITTDPKSGRPWTRVAFSPLTGRTHQLRLHAAHPLGLGCPIVGDSLYGLGQRGAPLLLHAALLGFSHPISGEWLEFSSTPPF